MVRRVQASELAYSVKLQGMETHKQFREVVQVRQTGARSVSQPLSRPMEFPTTRCEARCSSPCGDVIGSCVGNSTRPQLRSVFSPIVPPAAPKPWTAVGQHLHTELVADRAGTGTSFDVRTSALQPLLLPVVLALAFVAVSRWLLHKLEPRRGAGLVEDVKRAINDPANPVRCPLSALPHVRQTSGWATSHAPGWCAALHSSCRPDQCDAPAPPSC